MIIEPGAAAANRRIYGRIENIEGTAPVDKGGSAAVKVVNGTAPGGNWTNTLVYESNSGDHYIELTEAELAALASTDTVAWGFSAADVRTAIVIPAQVMGLAKDATVAKDALVEGHVVAAIQSIASTYTRSDVSILADGTEQILYENAAPADNWIPDNININLSVMQSGDALTVRTYVKQKSGGAYILYDTQGYSGVQAVAGISGRGLPNRYGMKITIEQTAGTYRTFEAEVMVIS